MVNFVIYDEATSGVPDTVVASEHHWVEKLHPRGHDGKFIEKTNPLLPLLTPIETPSHETVVSQVMKTAQKDWDHLTQVQQHTVRAAVLNAKNSDVPEAASALQKIDKWKATPGPYAEKLQPGGPAHDAVKKFLDSPSLIRLSVAAKVLNDEKWAALSDDERKKFVDFTSGVDLAKSPLMANAVSKIGDLHEKHTAQKLKSHLPAATFAEPKTKVAETEFAVSAHKGAAPGSPAKVTTSLIWDKYPHDTVILTTKNDDERVRWDEEKKRFVREVKIHGAWGVTDTWTKKDAYANLKGDTHWEVPGPEGTGLSASQPPPGGTNAPGPVGTPGPGLSLEQIEKQYNKGLITSEELGPLLVEEGHLEPGKPVDWVVAALADSYFKVKNEPYVVAVASHGLTRIVWHPDGGDHPYVVEHFSGTKNQWEKDTHYFGPYTSVASAGMYAPKNGGTWLVPTVEQQEALHAEVSNADLQHAGTELLDAASYVEGGNATVHELLETIKENYPGLTDEEIIAEADKQDVTKNGPETTPGYFADAYASEAGTTKGPTGIDLGGALALAKDDAQLDALTHPKNPEVDQVLAVSADGQHQLVWKANTKNSLKVQEADPGGWVTIDSNDPDFLEENGTALSEILHDYSDEWMLPGSPAAAETSPTVAPPEDVLVPFPPIYLADDVISNWPGVVGKKHQPGDVVALSADGKYRVVRSPSVGQGAYEVQKRTAAGWVFGWTTSDLTLESVATSLSSAWVVPPPKSAVKTNLQLAGEELLNTAGDVANNQITVHEALAQVKAKHPGLTDAEIIAEADQQGEEKFGPSLTNLGYFAGVYAYEQKTGVGQGDASKLDLTDPSTGQVDWHAVGDSTHLFADGQVIAKSTDGSSTLTWNGYSFLLTHTYGDGSVNNSLVGVNALDQVPGKYPWLTWQSVAGQDGHALTSVPAVSAPDPGTPGASTLGDQPDVAAETDTSSLSYTVKVTLKNDFKTAGGGKVGYWSKPGKIWDVIKEVQKQHPDPANPGHSKYTPLQVLKVLDELTNTKDPDPHQTKISKWLQTPAGKKYVSEVAPVAAVNISASNAPNVPNVPSTHATGYPHTSADVDVDDVIASAPTFQFTADITDIAFDAATDSVIAYGKVGDHRFRLVRSVDNGLWVGLVQRRGPDGEWHTIENWHGGTEWPGAATLGLDVPWHNAYDAKLLSGEISQSTIPVTSPSVVVPGVTHFVTYPLTSDHDVDLVNVSQHGAVIEPDELWIKIIGAKSAQVVAYGEDSEGASWRVVRDTLYHSPRAHLQVRDPDGKWTTKWTASDAQELLIHLPKNVKTWRDAFEAKKLTGAVAQPVALPNHPTVDTPDVNISYTIQHNPVVKKTDFFPKLVDAPVGTVLAYGKPSGGGSGKYRAVVAVDAATGDKLLRVQWQVGNQPWLDMQWYDAKTPEELAQKYHPVQKWVTAENAKIKTVKKVSKKASPGTTPVMKVTVASTGFHPVFADVNYGLAWSNGSHVSAAQVVADATAHPETQLIAVHKKGSIEHRVISALPHADGKPRFYVQRRDDSTTQGWQLVGPTEMSTADELVKNFPQLTWRSAKNASVKLQTIASTVTQPKVKNSALALPGGLAGIGEADISHITEEKRAAIFAKFKKSPGAGKYLASDAQKIYETAKPLADAEGLNLLQLLRVIDDQGAKKSGAANAQVYENKIVAWLKTPKGHAFVTSGGTPTPPTPAYSKGVGHVPPLVESDQHKYKIVPSVAAANVEWKKIVSTYGSDLTASQRASLKAYTGGPYDPINKYLYGKNATISATNANHIKNAQAGMRPAVSPMLLHRGVFFDALGAKNHSDLEKMVGQTRVQEGFGSSSVGGKPAFGSRPVWIEIEAPPGTPVAWVQPFSQYPGEDEMLLGAGLHYKIIGVEHKNTSGGMKSVVRVRVVPPP